MDLKKHPFKANCAELHVIQLWHLHNPGKMISDLQATNPIFITMSKTGIKRPCKRGCQKVLAAARLNALTKGERAEKLDYEEAKRYIREVLPQKSIMSEASAEQMAP